MSARLARLCRLAWVRTSANNGRVRPAVLPCEILPKSQEAASEKLTQTPRPVFGAACEISFAAPRDPRRVAPKSHKQIAPRDVPQGVFLIRCQKKSNAEIAYIVFYLLVIILYIVVYRFWESLLISGSPVRAREGAPETTEIEPEISIRKRNSGFYR